MKCYNKVISKRRKGWRELELGDGPLASIVWF